MHEHISFKHGRIRNRPYAHGGFFGAAPFMLANPDWNDILRQLMPEVYDEVSKRVTNSPAYKLIHWAENNPVVAAYGTVHELVENGMCAQIHRRNSDAINISVHNSHNNAGACLNNNHSTNLLDSDRITNPPSLEWDVFLDPTLVKQVERALSERDKFIRLRSSILDKNNNYGSLPENIEDFNGRDIEECSSYSLSSSSCSYWSLSQAKLEQKQEKRQSQVQLSNRPQLHTLEEHDMELQKKVQELVDKMLIAHGNLTQLILEQTGYAKRYNYSSIGRTCKTLGGGITARQWMAVYAEALRLVLKEEHEDHAMTRSENISTATDFYAHEDCSNNDCNNKQDISQYQYEYHTSEYFLEEEEEEDAASFRDSNRSAYFPHRATVACLKNSHPCRNRSIAESISILKDITQQEQPVGIVLDIKSRHINKRVWACVVDALRTAGVRVEAISSFTISEIRDISRYCHQPVNETFFFHSAGDLQRACHSGQILRGDRVFFNAGSLLGIGDSLRRKQSISTRLYHQMQSLTITCYCTGYDPDFTKSNYRILPFARHCRRIDGGDVGYDRVNNIYYYDTYRGSTIQQYKERFNLSIGLYCQEFAIDDAAVDLIVKLVNENPELYDLGLSWGGVNGVTVKGIQPSRFSTTDGFASQRYVGAKWDNHLMPPRMLANDVTAKSATTTEKPATATDATPPTSDSSVSSDSDASSSDSVPSIRSAE